MKVTDSAGVVLGVKDEDLEGGKSMEYVYTGWTKRLGHEMRGQYINDYITTTLSTIFYLQFWT